jgi:hypothetical protein
MYVPAAFPGFVVLGPNVRFEILRGKLQSRSMVMFNFKLVEKQILATYGRTDYRMSQW